LDGILGIDCPFPKKYMTCDILHLVNRLVPWKKHFSRKNP
jgi:hypothetical protein